MKETRVRSLSFYFESGSYDAACQVRACLSYEATILQLERINKVPELDEVAKEDKGHDGPDFDPALPL